MCFVLLYLDNIHCPVFLCSNMFVKKLQLIKIFQVILQLRVSLVQNIVTHFFSIFEPLHNISLFLLKTWMSCYSRTQLPAVLVSPLFTLCLSFVSLIQGLLF